LGAGVIGLGGVGVVKGAQAFADLNVEAAKYLQIEQGFESLIGGGSAKYFEQLQEAADGTISKLDLLSQTNRALLLGVSQSLIPQRIEGSRKIAQATGQDPGFLFESIALGIGRQSKLLLDNLGIIVRSEEAYDAYAKKLGKTSDELTEQEKKIAFTEAAVQGLEDRVASLGGVQDNLTDSTKKLQASWSNLRIEIGKGLVESGTLKELTDLLTLLTDIAAVKIGDQSIGSIGAGAIIRSVISKTPIGKAYLRGKDIYNFLSPEEVPPGTVPPYRAGMEPVTGGPLQSLVDADIADKAAAIADANKGYRDLIDFWVNEYRVSAGPMVGKPSITNIPYKVDKRLPGVDLNLPEIEAFQDALESLTEGTFFRFSAAVQDTTMALFDMEGGMTTFRDGLLTSVRGIKGAFAQTAAQYISNTSKTGLLDTAITGLSERVGLNQAQSTFGGRLGSSLLGFGIFGGIAAGIGGIFSLLAKKQDDNTKKVVSQLEGVNQKLTELPDDLGNTIVGLQAKQVPAHLANSGLNYNPRLVGGSAVRPI